MKLLVDPSDRSGAGAARYELKRSGSVVWSGEQPFTLWDASVADDGTVGGYGYSLGYNRAFDKPGDFLVVILDPVGEPRLVEKTPRKGSLREHAMADPKADGVFLDLASDRLVVRVSDPDTNGGEAWWTYRLATGEPLGKASPTEIPEEPGGWWILDAKPVARTALTLVHWWGQDLGNTKPSATGARFALVDASRAQVWMLDLPGDYAARGDLDAKARLHRSILEHGAILDTATPGRFEIRHAADGVRVSYTVERSKHSPNDWTVREVARAPYLEPGPAQAAGALVFPEVALRKLGSISLADGAAPSEDSPIRGIAQFAIDDRGRFGFLRCHECGTAAQALVVVDADGALIQSVALPQLPENRFFTRHLAWIEGDRWLVATSEYGDETKTSAVWIDLGTGTATTVEGFDCPQIEALAPTRDGGFVALTAAHEGALYAFDARGGQRWRVESEYEDETKLFSPQDVTVTATGEVVVLELIKKRLKVYGPDGVYRHAVDLEQAWGRSPRYLSGIAADADAGVVVFDFGGAPPVVRMKRDGSVRAELTPAFPGKRVFGIQGRVQTGPDGRLWASDGHALLRLDERGVVDRVLGPKPDPEALGSVEAIAVDAKGGIYAADRRTAAVHVFDAEGRRVRVFRPDAGDYDGDYGSGLRSSSLAISDAGDVFVSRGKLGHDWPQFVHYSPSRGRVGVESLGLDPVTEEWLWQPATRNRWVLGYENVFLVGADGKAMRAIERTSQGQWLERPGPAGVAPDGRIAVVSAAMPHSVEEGEGPRVVAIFSREGDALATWPAPEGLLPYSGAAFDGARFVALVRAPSRGGEAGPSIAVAALDAKGKPLFRFEPPAGSDHMRVFLVPRAGETELWLFDGRAAIDRYALP